MKKYIVKSIQAFALIALMLSALTFTGCITPSRLDAGGAYAATETSKANPELFAIDSSFDLAYSALNLTFTYEKNNRLALWNINKDIKQSLDKIRAEATVIVFDYATARKEYLANPTPAGLDTLGEVLIKLQSANAAALKVIQTKTEKGV